MVFIFLTLEHLYERRVYVKSYVELRLSPLFRREFGVRVKGVPTQHPLYLFTVLFEKLQRFSPCIFCRCFIICLEFAIPSLKGMVNIIVIVGINVRIHLLKPFRNVQWDSVVMGTVKHQQGCAI